MDLRKPRPIEPYITTIDRSMHVNWNILRFSPPGKQVFQIINHFVRKIFIDFTICVVILQHFINFWNINILVKSNDDVSFICPGKNNGIILGLRFKNCIVYLTKFPIFLSVGLSTWGEDERLSIMAIDRFLTYVASGNRLMLFLTIQK